MPPEPKLDEVSVHGLKKDVRQLNEQLNQNTKVLHGRIGGLDERITTMDAKHDRMAADLSELNSRYTSIDTKMDHVLSNQEKQQVLELHREKVRIETEANKSVELVKLDNTKTDNRGKLLVGLISLISGLIGAGVHFFAGG